MTLTTNGALTHVERTVEAAGYEFLGIDHLMPAGAPEGGVEVTVRVRVPEDVGLPPREWSP